MFCVMLKWRVQRKGNKYSEKSEDQGPFLLFRGFAYVWRKGIIQDPVLVGAHRVGLLCLRLTLVFVHRARSWAGPSAAGSPCGAWSEFLPSWVFLFPSSFCSSIPLILFLMTQFAFSPACRGVTRLFPALAALQLFIHWRMIHLKYQSLLLDPQNPPISKQCLNSWDKCFSHNKQDTVD